MIRLALVAFGGSVGAVARYALSGWVARSTREAPFPYGTLTVNLVGSLLLGLLMGAAATGPFMVSGRVRSLVAIGFLGAFTTFSTFTYETMEAFRVGDWRVALANVAVSVAMCLGACWLGLTVGERL